MLYNYQNFEKILLQLKLLTSQNQHLRKPFVIQFCDELPNFACFHIYYLYFHVYSKVVFCSLMIVRVEERWDRIDPWSMFQYQSTHLVPVQFQILPIFYVAYVYLLIIRSRIFYKISNTLKIFMIKFIEIKSGKFDGIIYRS